MSFKSGPTKYTVRRDRIYPHKWEVWWGYHILNEFNTWHDAMDYVIGKPWIK